MNEAISKKNRIIYLLSFVALTLVLLLFGVSVIRGGERESLAGLDSINEDASHILVTGNNYSLDDSVEEELLQSIQEMEPKEQEQVETEQESIVPQEEKKEESPEPKEEKPTVENEEPKTENTLDNSNAGEEKSPSDTTSSDDSNGEDEGSGESGPSPSEDEREKPASKNPVIECSLAGVTEIQGDSLVFTVRARDYKNQLIDSFYYQVKLDGELLYSTGKADDGFVTYRSSEELGEGTHEVTIFVEDSEKNSEAASFVVNAVGAEPVLKDEYASLTIRADTINLGTVLSVKEKIYDGESASHFIERVLEMNGFSVVSSGGIYGYYLGEIGKPGLLDSMDAIEIPEILAPYLEDVDREITDRDSLGERDFTPSSGWVYLYNYAYMGVGLSNITLFDGDEIVICFTLANGAEFDGTWFSYGEW